jgi:hypothetical protein
MSDFLLLARQAQSAADPIVAKTFADQLMIVDDYYEGLPGEAAWRAFARARLAPAFARVGWDAKPGEADNDALLRQRLLVALGRLGDPAVIAEARRRFTAYLAAPESLQGAQRLTVLQVVAIHADAALWEQLHTLARGSSDVSDKTRLYGYLGAAGDPALADKALALALSGEPSPTDAPEIISAVAVAHPDKAFAFALAHRATVEALLEPTSRVTFVTRLAAGSRDPAMPAKLRAFAATIPASARAEVDKAITAVTYRAGVIQKRLPGVDRWLAANPG